MDYNSLYSLAALEMGLFWGLICGAIPLFTSIFKQQKIALGFLGLFVCAVGGLIGGLLLGIPLAALFTYLVLKKINNTTEKTENTKINNTTGIPEVYSLPIFEKSLLYLITLIYPPIVFAYLRNITVLIVNNVIYIFLLLILLASNFNNSMLLIFIAFYLINLTTSMTYLHSSKKINNIFNTRTLILLAFLCPVGSIQLYIHQIKTGILLFLIGLIAIIASFNYSTVYIIYLICWVVSLKDAKMFLNTF
ncbi:hypothetical protein [Caldanaerobacter subterraneus]|uniref:Uncharacterized protein n=1 Tax=Caldanaerobacter subterraneus subsp. pacificus DSM 12653 TaxID=391606 RepID=B7R6S2_9THEO|nr:hypothetical protein [Caldanaerobacter subterraneus]KKC30922.1 hypothetical protein CDSM653_00019 [Caldanaerobacter subterraneus subsp. pacificus DSM 12653]